MKLKCHICKEHLDSYSSLSRHIRKHGIALKKYYDKYLKSKNEGICPVCGNKCSFDSLRYGYRKHCCIQCSNNDPATKKKYEETCLERFGFKSAISNPEIKERQKVALNKNGGFTLQRKELKKIVHSKMKKKYGNAYYLKSKKGQDKFKKSMIKNYGVDNPQKSKKIRIKTQNTNLDRYGFKNPIQNKDILRKVEATNIKRYGFKSVLCDRELMEECYLKHFGVRNPSQSKEIIAKIKDTFIKKIGVSHPMKLDGEFQKRFEERLKKNHGFLSKPEYIFSKKLKKAGLKFKSEYFIKGDDYSHHFDFAILNKKENIKCLVEIDGRYWHGLSRDCDGKFSGGACDYLRWELVPKGVKFLVIDSERLDEGFEELTRILPIKYKKWKKEILKSIPKDIKAAIPNFSKTRMRTDWDSLCRYAHRTGAFLGKSILLNFCHSHWKDFDWKSIRKTLYKSPVSSHHLLEGLDHFKNTSELREKFREKYRGVKEVIVKHHSPEKMLAICSLGKTYISKEKIDKESKRIIKFLKLKAFEK